MIITQTEINKMAKLARISFNDEEKSKLQIELGSIITWMEMLAEVDVSDIQDDAAIEFYGHSLVMHDDIQCNKLSREELLANAPSQVHGYFAVPKVLGGGE